MDLNSYISCACNNLPHAADWGRNNLICFAANYAVAVYDPVLNKFGKIIRTFHNHTNRVNTVKWIKPFYPNLETEFISCSSDGTAIIWRTKKSSTSDYAAISTIQINEPITLCDATYLSYDSSDLLIVTGSISGEFKIWLRKGENDVELMQTLNFLKKLPIATKFILLPNNLKFNPVLLISMEDNSIHIYSNNIDQNDLQKKKIENFTKVQALVGHENWVTCIDYTIINSANVFIASGSQDNFIRLWKISPKWNDNSENESLKTTKQNFVAQNFEYEIILESVLSGHEAWVYGVNWHPPIEVNGKFIQPLKLLSCSLDKTAIVWEQNKSNDLWSETIRVGEVGGNSLGFYGCKFGPNGKSILAHGFQGSMHMWEFKDESNNWKPKVTPTGHFNEVVDLCWEPRGRFLFTTSADQTTRIHAPWTVNEKEVSWHEIGRPQIHGYDMSCITTLSPYVFASGAEEKVIRIFTAPLTFKNYLQNITKDVDDFKTETFAEVASVPALGLTNKAILVDDCDDRLAENLFEIQKIEIDYNEPPTEEDLIRRSLWPELQKLYGHGYEIFSITSSYGGRILATACKSTSLEHASIILWDTFTWTQKQKLHAHQLTVTQMEFSPNNKYLLAVSRDRRWSLFAQKNDIYELLTMSSKKDSLHTRIIWCCSWTYDSKYFVTGSRDGNVGIWKASDDVNEILNPVTKLHIINTSVTAVAFSPIQTEELFSYILAIGYENGCIDVKKVKEDSNSFSWDQIKFLNTSDAHHLTVKKLAFRPIDKTENKNYIQLASCGSDKTVKIHNILIN